MVMALLPWRWCARRIPACAGVELNTRVVHVSWSLGSSARRALYRGNAVDGLSDDLMPVSDYLFQQVAAASLLAKLTFSKSCLLDVKGL